MKCKESGHSEDCRGPGDIHHIREYWKSRTITQIMGQILSHCGDNVSPSMSCPCWHAVDALMSKFKNLDYSQEVE